MAANQKSSKARPPAFSVAANEERCVLTPYGITGIVQQCSGSLATVPFAMAPIMIVSVECGRKRGFVLCVGEGNRKIEAENLSTKNVCGSNPAGARQYTREKPSSRTLSSKLKTY